MDLTPLSRNVQSPTYSISPNAQANHGDALRSTEGPTAAEWMAVKDEIRALYATKPLKVVRKIMEDRRGFKATERMYKARLSQWKLNKNSSDKDYQICAYLHKLRCDQGKASTAFVINGNNRSLKDLRKYIKGRKMSEDGFLAQAIENIAIDQLNDEQHVRAFTPEAELDTLESKQQQQPKDRLGSPANDTLDRIDSVKSSDFSPGYLTQSTSSQYPALQLNVSEQSTTHSGLTSYTSSPKYLTPSSTNSANTSDPFSTNTGLLNDAPPPTRPRNISSASSGSCQHFRRNLEMMAYQTVHSKPLSSIYGSDDIVTWGSLSPQAKSESDGTTQDYETICPHCRQSTSSHFASLLDGFNSTLLASTPARQRELLNPTPELGHNALTIPASTMEHDHSWKWVARCFALCIALTNQNQQNAARAGADADAEFEAMLKDDDPKTIMALNQTLTVLHMHNQGDICRRIIARAQQVAERTLGGSHPISTLVKWMVYVAEPTKLREQKEITSYHLFNISQYFIQRYGEKDCRSISSLYCYGFMLNVEQHLGEAEQVLRQCYELACEVLGRQSVPAITALVNLRLCLERQDRIDEAIEVAKTAVSDSLETFGKTHPRRLETIRLLGVMYERRGQLEETERLYWQVLDGRVRTLGKNHTFTLGMKESMIELEKKMGKWNDEEQGGCEALTRIKDIFEWDTIERWDVESLGSDDIQQQAREAY